MIRTLLRSALLITLLSFAANIQAQQFYVIVGAFALESNAQKFTGYVRSLRYAAEYEVHKEKKLFYVYVLKSTLRADAVLQAKQLQQESEFKDAWLFSGHLGTSPPPQPVEVAEAVPPVAEPVTEPSATDSAVTTTAPKDPISATPPPITSSPAAETEIKARGKLFMFQVQTADGRTVNGEIHSVDYKRGRDLAVYKSNEYVDVLPPPKDNNPMSLVCGIFGYKEIVLAVNYNKPADVGATQDAKGAWVIPYQLERLKKGDVSVMYHVAFFKDAVVMLPQSKGEMDELVNMMKDNPSYRIKIHGHCNGNNTRKIIALGTSKNYFNIQGSDERNGSAKELSKLRAEAVQSYLTDNGITNDRMSIYAWGGLNMLVPETGTSAKLNDRIEIEIQAD